LDTAVAQYVQNSQRTVLSSAELRERCRQLAEEIRVLKEQPIAKQIVRYRTPVSQPVHSEELLFECFRGRVACMDMAALLAEGKRGLEDKGKLLRTRWQVEDITPPVGAFRLHYIVERNRELMDSLGGEVPPAPMGNYRYGLSEWRVESVAPTR